MTSGDDDPITVENDACCRPGIDSGSTVTRVRPFTVTLRLTIVPSCFRKRMAAVVGVVPVFSSAIRVSKNGPVAPSAR